MGRRRPVPPLRRHQAGCEPPCTRCRRRLSSCCCGGRGARLPQRALDFPLHRPPQSPPLGSLQRRRARGQPSVTGSPRAESGGTEIERSGQRGLDRSRQAPPGGEEGPLPTPSPEPWQCGSSRPEPPSLRQAAAAAPPSAAAAPEAPLRLPQPSSRCSGSGWKQALPLPPQPPPPRLCSCCLEGRRLPPLEAAQQSGAGGRGRRGRGGRLRAGAAAASGRRMRRLQARLLLLLLQCGGVRELGAPRGQRLTGALPAGRMLGRGVTGAAAGEAEGARPLPTRTAQGAAHRSSSSDICSSSSTTVCCRGLLRPPGLADRPQAQGARWLTALLGRAGRPLAPCIPSETAEGRGGGRACSSSSSRVDSVSGVRGSGRLTGGARGGLLARPSPAAAGRMRGGLAAAERGWPQRACASAGTGTGRGRAAGLPLLTAAGLLPTPSRPRGRGSAAPRP